MSAATTKETKDQLTIAEDLHLPLDAATQTFAILAMRGVGKTYTAAVLAEELLKAGLQVVVIDPLDVWWGLRASADGEGVGLPIVVLGGTRGDIELHSGQGALLADLVVERGISVVLSSRHMSKGDQRRFVTDFCERLYHRKGEPEYRQPLHIFIDEADAFAPQKVFGDQARVLGAVDDLVRRGRASGVGVTLITQRASAINKDVLTQSEVLVALRTVHRLDRKAVGEWVEAHDVEGQQAEFMSSLASLPIGTAWFWSPGWLKIFQKVRVRRRETFDSSSTPKVGEEVRAPKLRPIDMEELRGALAETIEERVQNDPRVLRVKIRELEEELRTRPSEVRVETVVERMVVPTIPEGAIDRLRAIEVALVKVQEELRTARMGFQEVERGQRSEFVEAMPSEPQGQEATFSDYKPRPRSGSTDAGALDRGATGILATLVSRHPMKVTRSQLATLSGRSIKSSSFTAQVATLKREGYIEETGGLICATRAGLDLYGGARPSPQSSAEVQEMWRRALDDGPRKMLDELIRVFPHGHARDDLARNSGYSPTSSSVGAHLKMLRDNNLAEVRDGKVFAAETLFLNGR